MRLSALLVCALLALSACGGGKESKRSPWYPHFITPSNVLDPRERQTIPIREMAPHHGAVQVEGKIIRIGADRVMIEDETGAATIYLGPAYDQRLGLEIGQTITVFGIRDYATFWAKEISIDGTPFKPAAPYR